ncbi:MAG TPA: hypothetical protein PKD00_00975 [Burkholderiales bacterium]|nr:hypothetical protein [Burkholderiales bacterium]
MGKTYTYIADLMLAENQFSYLEYEKQKYSKKRRVKEENNKYRNPFKIINKTLKKNF